MAFLRRLRTQLGLRKEKKAWVPAEFSGTRPPDAATFFGRTFERRSDIGALIRPGGIGVELGVARGEFSDALLEHSELDHLYSIDMWAGDRSHTVAQYREAILRLQRHGARSSVIRLRFDEALPLFPDSHFDFIYVDGYAGTGQEDGKTLEDWWPKLKPGGLFSGDDYSPKYPLVMTAVDRFATTHGLAVYLIEPQVRENVYAQQPTWLCLKPDK